jgi:AraC-like DNA-binding protein
MDDVSDPKAGMAAAAGTQSFRERLPIRRLDPYVTSIWIQQVPRNAPPFRHRTAPNGSAEIVCQVDRVPAIIGPQTGPDEYVVPPGTVVVGVRLRPCALAAVIGIPAVELVDHSVRLDDLCGTRAAAIGEMVANAKSAVGSAAVLEAGVLALLTEDSVPDPVVAGAVRRLQQGNVRDVASLAAAIGISRRQLRRRCEAAVGLPPKPLHRILRLQRFLALTRRHDLAHRNLALLAAQASFADQSHLSRECLRLTGRSPGTALHEAEQNCNGLHDHRASDAPLLASIPPARPDPPVVRREPARLFQR